MQTVDDKPETIHLYVVREKEIRPPIIPIVFSMLALFALSICCVFAPYQQPVVRMTLRVPAILLPSKMFTATVAIIPTGVRVYSATTAHGVLTITNGSIIGQYIPAGFTIDGVATDRAMYVPGGSANEYGWAQVSAHAGNPGKNGNIPALAINSVVGSSVYIRNLSAFSGGRDSYSVKFATAQDKQATLTKARDTLTLMSKGLHYPCSESYIADVPKMLVAWRCQMLTYHIADFYHVTGVRISGKNLLISVWFVPRPIRYWVK